MTCRLGSSDSTVRGTMFSRRPPEGRNNIRKIGTTALVKDASVKVRLGPAVVDDLGGEDRREEKGENEQEFHSWRSSVGPSPLARYLAFVPSPENLWRKNQHGRECVAKPYIATK